LSKKRNKITIADIEESIKIMDQCSISGPRYIYPLTESEKMRLLETGLVKEEDGMLMIIEK